MAQCEFCEKTKSVGNQITTRGKAKYLGGVGTKVTGISRRQFKPNLQRVKVTIQGSNRTINACTQCIRSGAVTKRIKAAPFRLPNADTAKKADKPAKAVKKEAPVGKEAAAKKK